jgi:hypothetical protein
VIGENKLRFCRALQAATLVFIVLMSYAVYSKALAGDAEVDRNRNIQVFQAESNNADVTRDRNLERFQLAPNNAYTTRSRNLNGFELATPARYTLTVSSAHDTPIPGNGPRTCDHGEWVTCSVTSPVTEWFTTWYCIGWTGTGSVPSSGIGNSVSFPITEDSTITWNWVTSTQDSDRDGLLDIWETLGIDSNNDGIVDLDLRALGANPNHKDLFLEIDYMRSDGIHDHRPDENAVAVVKKAFANAPIHDNPDGINGITLHVLIDDSDNIPHHDTMNVYDREQNSWPEFDSNKTAYFGTLSERSDANSVNILEAKRMVYRYCIFIHQYAEWDKAAKQWVATTSSGIAERPGNDFIVSLGAFTNQNGSRDEQAGTLIHELGHTLGLQHGGGDNINCKPNYLSVMSYSRQFSDLISDRPLDYSNLTLPTLDEGHLDETVGIGGPAGGTTVFGPGSPKTASSSGPIDWNRDNDGGTDRDVAVNINDFTFRGIPNPDPSLDTPILRGYDDWANLHYNFRDTRDYEDGEHLEAATDCITWEIVQEMRNTGAPPVGGEWIPIDIAPMSTNLFGSALAISAIAALFVGFKRIRKKQN